jgi:short-subunit dehydrogenase
VAGLEGTLSPRPFLGKLALVTGATSGIGRAVAIEFARRGGALLLSGRSAARLEEVAGLARRLAADATVHRCDLAREEEVLRLAERARAHAPRLDVLVHAAGVHRAGPVADVPGGDLDTLYAVNVRAPYVLTRELLPALRLSRGQIVFVNSSAVFASEPGLAAYGLTKHALRALADHLRPELRGDGVRVLSVYPGRTATAMQESIHAAEGAPYVPERLLQPEDVATAVLDAIGMPCGAEVTDLRIRPAGAR